LANQAKYLVGLAGMFALWIAQPVAAADKTPDSVSIPADGEYEPKTLDAMLFKPQGQGPFPAIVAMHGCSGLWSSKNETKLSPRHADWGQRLMALGFVVIFPDSYGSRGLGAQCKNDDREVEPYRERVEDANAARRYLQTLPYVNPNAIALLGWSNGGSTVLYTVRPQDRPKAGSPDFRAAVAFYPGCTAQAEKRDWASRVPLLILMGDADDWTPATPCKKLAAANADSVKLILYPGAYHDFDNEAQKLHKLKGLAFTANGDGTAHAGLNPAARAAALKDVPDFLTVLKQ
jgi:dienelactone hydrolase